MSNSTRIKAVNSISTLMGLPPIKSLDCVNIGLGYIKIGEAVVAEEGDKLVADLSGGKIASTEDFIARTTFRALTTERSVVRQDLFDSFFNRLNSLLTERTIKTTSEKVGFKMQGERLLVKSMVSQGRKELRYNFIKRTFSEYAPADDCYYVIATIPEGDAEGFEENLKHALILLGAWKYDI